MERIKSISWATAYSITPKVLQGVKFLLLTRLLGPHEFGNYAFSLIWIAVAEGLSEFGFRQAIIQSKTEISSDLNAAINSLLLIRGFVISFCMILVSMVLGKWFVKIDLFSVAYISVIPLFRGLYAVRTAVVLRRLNFKRMFAFEISWRTFDCIITFCLLYMISYSSTTAVLATSIAEFIAVIVAFAVLDNRIAFSNKISLAKPLTQYGRWIWGQSLLSVLLNQFDKLYVIGHFGSAAMGAYQGVNRFVQLCMADPINMLVNAWFPKLARDIRIDEERTWVGFNNVIHVYMLLSGIIITLVTVFQNELIVLIFGEMWSNVGHYLPVFTLIMTIGGLITLLVTWFRSIGRPQYVTISTIVQAIVYVALICVVGNKFGSIGIAYVVLIAGFSASFILFASLNSLRFRAVVFSADTFIFLLNLLSMLLICLMNKIFVLIGILAFIASFIRLIILIRRFRPMKVEK